MERSSHLGGVRLYPSEQIYKPKIKLHFWESWNKRNLSNILEKTFCFVAARYSVSVGKVSYMHPWGKGGGGGRMDN